MKFSKSHSMLLAMAISFLCGLAVAPPAYAQSKDKDAKPKAGAATPATPAPAGAADAPAEAVAAWAVSWSDRVQGKFQCEMTQSIVDQNSRGQIILIAVRPPSDGGAKVMLFRVGHGVYLPAGLNLKIDSGTATPIPFQKSDQLGVYAALPLTDPMIADLKKGKEMKIAIELNKGQPAEIGAPLNGFGPAFERVSSTK